MQLLERGNFKSAENLAALSRLCSVCVYVWSWCEENIRSPPLVLIGSGGEYSVQIVLHVPRYNLRPDAAFLFKFERRTRVID